MDEIKAGDRVRMTNPAGLTASEGGPFALGDVLTVKSVHHHGWLYFDKTEEGFGVGPSRVELVKAPAKSTAELTAEANAKGEGFKADAGKLDWTLFPFDGAEEVVRVLELGAEKYARDNWRSVPDAINRYRKAGLRHRIADALGEVNDPETGKSHLAHSVCCDLFVLALLRAEKKTP
jgi:hypothetical protein